MSTVHLRDVVALLGRFPALAGVNLAIDPGEVVLLQGPNGAGKTTLLRVCAGLIRPTSGTAEILGYNAANQGKQIRRRVGLIAHSTGLYGDLSVVENVEFWARASAVAEPLATALEAIERLGIAERLHDLAVDRLSAGQRRRTSIAAMVVRRPEIWLLDEPHAGLDQSGRDIVDALILDAAAAGATVIVASHELERVGRLKPRAVTIAGGAVLSAAESQDDVAEDDVAEDDVVEDDVEVSRGS
ncbi:MAG: heme ABC exporter ATP-binding protein CcmA [Acidimicrobiales bacterium]